MEDIDSYILALAGDSGDEASAERAGNNGAGGGSKKSSASERPQASRRTSSVAGKGGKQSSGKSGRSKRRGDSDDDEDNIFDSDDEEEEGEADDVSSVDMDEDDDDLYKDEYGPDLYRDEEDRRRLGALPEVEREQILNERSEKRQEMLERKQIKQQVKLKMLKEGKGDDSARRSKMSKESKGEDLTRRSSRAKDSTRATTSRGLSELKRRREEKSTRPTSSGRGHGSESPERRKRRRGSGSGGSEDDYGRESEDSESEDEGKKSKRVPTLDEINSIRLSRTLLEKWMHAPFFKKTVIGCFTRIMLGLDPATKARVYRVTEITDVVDYHRAYRVETQLTNKCLVLKHGKASRNFTMDVVSNQPFTQPEYTRYFATLENEGVRGPTLDHVEAKREDLAGAHAYVLTDAEVDDMIRRKRALASVPSNVAAEKAGLLAKIEQAKEEGDNESLKELEARVKQIAEATAGGSGHEQLDAWARLNKKNRERDQKDLRVAEKRQVEERKKLVGANAQDPFARRKTLPKLVHAPIPSSSVSTPDTGNSPAGTPPLPPGSALAALNISGKPIVTPLEAPRVSEAAAAIWRTARPMSKYEEMVSRGDLDVEFDDDD